MVVRLSTLAMRRREQSIAASPAPAVASVLASAVVALSLTSLRRKNRAPAMRFHPRGLNC